MKILKTEVTKIELSELERLDSVQIIAEDLGPGRGKITISCYGESWTNFWGGMGDEGIIEFILTCNIEYLVEKLMPRYNKWEIDWEKINDDLLGEDPCGLLSSIDETTAYQYDDELAAQYGEGGDWRHNLPRCVTSDYEYLSRIIVAVQEGLSSANLKN